MDRILREKNKLKLDVVWGPTQTEVYEQMFVFTKPTKHDVLFDLGCGDGRILIAAAKKFGARGVGYDLDPQLIAKGQAAARRDGISQLIDLKTENLFAADLSSATIIALYLSDRINGKLKPKFFRELKPGTRIVSHNWHMGDWQYDARKAVANNERLVYYWVMPANFSGVWKSVDGKTELIIKQQYQMLEGTLKYGTEQKSFEQARAAGGKVTFQGIGAFELVGSRLVGAGYEFTRVDGTEEPFAL